MKTTHIMTALLLCMVLLVSCTDNNNSDKQNPSPVITKSDFASIACNTGALWKDLLSKGYITSTGAITLSFRALTRADDMNLDIPFAYYHENIFNILTQDIYNVTAAQSDFSYLAVDVDALFIDLTNTGYIDTAGAVSSTFRSLKDADDMILGNAFEYYRINIYTILKQDIANAAVSESDLSSLGCDTNALLTDLETHGYINSAGVITDAFRVLSNTGEMILSAEFLSYRADIFNTLHLIMDNVKASKSDFASIGCNTDSMLNDLEAHGYINSSGMITDAFRVLSNTSEMILSAEFISYRADIFHTLHLIMDNAKASKSDFASIGLDTDALLDDLKTHGYINSTGVVTNAFHVLSSAREMTLSTDFTNYSDDIFKILQQCITVSESDFTSLTFNVDALWNNLLANAYITSTGEITNSFKQLSIADEMTIDSEFEKYRDGIFLIMERVIAE